MLALLNSKIRGITGLKLWHHFNSWGTLALFIEPIFGAVVATLVNNSSNISGNAPVKTLSYFVACIEGTSREMERMKQQGN
jgi:hypothetical protein